MENIPPNVLRLLEPYFDRSLLLSTRIDVAIPHRAAAMVRMVNLEGMPMAAHWVPIGASPELGLIVVHPDYWDGVLSGDPISVGLVSHEMCHQKQTAENPNFLEDFDWTASNLPAGASPEANLWEHECYEFERDVVRKLMRSGGPRRLVVARRMPDEDECHCGPLN